MIWGFEIWITAQCSQNIVCGHVVHKLIHVRSERNKVMLFSSIGQENSCLCSSCWGNQNGIAWFQRQPRSEYNVFEPSGPAKPHNAKVCPVNKVPRTCDVFEKFELTKGIYNVCPQILSVWLKNVSSKWINQRKLITSDFRNCVYNKK